MPPEEKGQLADDFDSVFGGSNTNNDAIVDERGYGSWLPSGSRLRETPTTSTTTITTTTTPQKKVTKEEASNMINVSRSIDLFTDTQDILKQRSPIISPTLPRIKVDLNGLENDPLDLDRFTTDETNSSPPPPSTVSPKRNRTSIPKATPSTSTVTRTSRRLSSSSSIGVTTRSKPTTIITFSPYDQLVEHLKRMEQVSSQEQMSGTHTVEEWKSIMTAIEKIEEIELNESAKPLKSPSILLAAITACLAWIADHLIDLIIRRIQVKSVTNTDPTMILTQVSQVNALREQSRQYYLQALYHSPLSPSPLLPLSSAAHRLHSPTLDDATNRTIYGKCNRKGGHGHNYRVEVTVTGELDESTGMIVNLVELKECIWKYVLEELDHRNLDQDVEYFHKRPSTTENVARYIWERLVERIPGSAKLYKVKLHETEKNHVVYRGPST